MKGTSARSAACAAAGLRFRGVSLVAAILLVLLVSQESRAQPFSQCPAVGVDTSCGILITVNPGPTFTVQNDPSQPTFDGTERDDTLIGVQNNSGAGLSQIKLSSSTDIFALEGDGLCTQAPSPAGCPFGPTGYEGPGVSFSVLNAFFGTVTFAGGIPDGGSAYFSVESTTVTICGNGVCEPHETCANCPEDCSCVDHFKSYDAKDVTVPRFQPQTVTLIDEFEPFPGKLTAVIKPARFYTPVDKNGEGINDSLARLTCYKIKDSSGQLPFLGKTVDVTNQFGLLRLMAKKAKLLCVPPTPALTLPLDHFKCYKARDLKVPAKFQKLNVTLSSNPIGPPTTTAQVLKPAFVCNPVMKDGSTIHNASPSHLICYKIKEKPKFAGGPPVSASDQFGTLQLALKKAKLLCVPSTSTVVP